MRQRGRGEKTWVARTLGAVLAAGVMFAAWTGTAHGAPTHFTGVQATPISMTVIGILTEEGGLPPNTAEIGVYDPQGVLCGAAQVGSATINNKNGQPGHSFTLQIYGDDDTTPADEGAVTGDKLVFKVWIPAHDTFAAKEYQLASLQFSNGTYGAAPPALPPNLAFSDRASYGVDINAPHNQGPTCTSTPANPSGSENSLITFTLSCTDPESDLPITVALVAPQPGMAYNDATRTFTGTPPYDSVEHPALSTVYTVQFLATDSAGSSTSFGVGVTINDVNRSPTCSPSTASGSEGTEIDVTFTCTDPDGDTVSLAQGTIPAGATFDPATKILTWTPGYGTIVHPATQAVVNASFTATDGYGASVNVPLAITVTDTNRAPTCAVIPDKGVLENATLSFTLSCTDGDNDALTYSATNLPSWCTRTGATVNCSPDYNVVTTAEGTKLFTASLQASDGTLQSAPVTANITVTNVNRKPVVAAIASKTVAENAPLTFVVSATDPDGDATTIAATSLPSGAAFDPATKTFTWTPGYSTVTTAEVSKVFTASFTATDAPGGATSDPVSASITVTNVDRAPVVTAIPDKSVAENATLTFVVAATDADGDTTTIAATVLPTGATFTPATRTFTWTPSYATVTPAEGSKVFKATFTATDAPGRLTSAAVDVNITVTQTNAPPVVTAVPDKTVAENATLTFVVAATDVDATTPTIAMTANPAGATFNGTTFSWTPDYNTVTTAGGTKDFTATFTANDGSATSAPVSVKITVSDTNRPPTLTVPGAQTGKEGLQLCFNVTTSDPDGDAVTVAITGGGADGAAMNGNQFCWTPNYSQAGQYNVSLQASDGRGGNDSKSVAISIANDALAPVADAGPDQLVASGSLVQLNGSNSHDPDGTIVSYSWEGAEKALLSNPSSATPTFTAPNGGTDGISMLFELTVTDNDGKSSSDQVYVNVIGTGNHPPVADAGPDQTVNSAATVTLDGSASTDPDNDTLAYEWAQVAGSPVTLSNPAVAKPTFTAPTLAAAEALVFELSVNDPKGLLSRDRVTINVRAQGSNATAPVANAGADKQVNEKTAGVALDGTASTGTQITYLWKQVSGSPVTLSDPTVAQPTFTAPAEPAAGGVLEFELTVTDSQGLTSTDGVLVNVSNVNTMPVANAGPDQTAGEGALVTLDGSQSSDPDPDGRVVVYSWKQTSGPTVALSDTGAAKPTFTAPSVAADTVLDFELTVTDDLGAKNTDAMKVTVQNTINDEEGGGSSDGGVLSKVCFIDALAQGTGAGTGALWMGILALLGTIGAGRGRRS